MEKCIGNFDIGLDEHKNNIKINIIFSFQIGIEFIWICMFSNIIFI